jgi:hypothetical protein
MTNEEEMQSFDVLEKHLCDVLNQVNAVLDQPFYPKSGNIWSM